jgi:hypothetical protein
MTAIHQWFKNAFALSLTDTAARKQFWYTCFAAGVLFVILFQHLPIGYFANAAHDDGWFVQKAISVASGQWFGTSYDNLTLMKGPGYPFFLVMVSVAGIPVAMAEAALLAFATGLLCLNVARLTGAYRSCAAIFVITLWHPAFLTPRLLREGIYSSQIFLLLALLIDIFLIANSRRRIITSSFLFGFVFAWYWLTREEGGWIVPALAIFVIGAAIFAWRDPVRLRTFVIAGTIMLTSAVALTSMFGLINKVKYGTYQLVDFKDAGFNDALDALYSVQVGDRTPYLPIPRRVRLEVYKVSPHFAELRKFFDGQQPTPWSNEGCSYYPQTCGDIAGGWIVWAMRDAAASVGKYATPGVASRFFSDLAKEVRDACATGALTCESPLVPGLPYISSRQFADLPARMFDAAKSILTSDVLGIRSSLIMSSGDPAAIEQGALFLNSRGIAPSASRLEHKYTFNGWYMDSGHGWFTFLGRGEDFENAVTVPRQQSPDLVAVFGDPAANRQRFSVPILCDPNCTLEIRSETAASSPIKFSAIRPGGAIQVGAGQFYVDAIEEAGSAGSTVRDPRAALADKIRLAAKRPYINLGAPVLVFAFVSFLAILCIPRFRRDMKKEYLPVLLVALTLWLLVGARILLLALLHISVFPAVTPLYLLPAHYLVWPAAGLTFICLGRLLTAEYRRRIQPA